MRYINYFFLLNLTVRAGHFTVPPRQHLSIYDTNYSTMTIEQLQEKQQHIQALCEERNHAWLAEKPYRKHVRCVGTHCFFWGVSLPIATYEFLVDSAVPFSGLCGFVAGAYAMHCFVDWYGPDQPFRKAALQEISGVLQEKKLEVVKQRKMKLKQE